MAAKPPKNWLRARLAAWNALLMLTCHDMTRFCSQEQEGPLPLSVRWRMKLHFLVCLWCRRYRNQLGLIRRSLTSYPYLDPGQTHPGLPQEAKERLKKALRSE